MGLNISLLTSAYRVSVHDSTGITPNMIMLGREVNQPIVIKCGVITEKSSFDSQTDYVNQLCDKMYDIYKPHHIGCLLFNKNLKATYDHI